MLENRILMLAIKTFRMCDHQQFTTKLKVVRSKQTRDMFEFSVSSRSGLKMTINSFAQALQIRDTSTITFTDFCQLEAMQTLNFDF